MIRVWNTIYYHGEWLCRIFHYYCVKLFECFLKIFFGSYVFFFRLFLHPIHQFRKNPETEAFKKYLVLLSSFYKSYVEFSQVSIFNMLDDVVDVTLYA